MRTFSKIFFEMKKKIEKKRFFGGCWPSPPPRFKFISQSEKIWPLSAQHSYVKELTQNVPFWVDIVSTLADPIICEAQLGDRYWPPPLSDATCTLTPSGTPQSQSYVFFFFPRCVWDLFFRWFWYLLSSGSFLKIALPFDSNVMP